MVHDTRSDIIKLKASPSSDPEAEPGPSGPEQEDKAAA